jgi:hypothetical protein
VGVPGDDRAFALPPPWIRSSARRRQASDAAEAPVAIVEPVDRCQGLMRIVAVITEPAVITRILAHRVRARDPPARGTGPATP